MAVRITEIKRLPVRRDKQIPTSGSVISSGGGSTEYGTSSNYYDVTLSGFTSGSSENPSIFFTIDPDTGFFREGTNSIGVAVGGTERFRFDNNGAFYATDDIVGFSTYISDQRLKTSVVPIQKALDKIKHLEGISYVYIPDETKHYGCIAQEVEKIIPELVREHELINDETKYKTVRYTEIIPFLIEAVKELEKQIHELRNEVNYWRNYNT